MKPAIILCTLITMTFTGILSGCGEARQAYDCRRICERYADCVPGDQDVTQCAQECRQEGGQAFEERATECQQCITDPDNNSCVEEAFQCSDECAGVVP